MQTNAPVSISALRVQQRLPCRPFASPDPALHLYGFSAIAEEQKPVAEMLVNILADSCRNWQNYVANY